MQTPDDEQFEAYLKRFRPIAPEPVLALNSGHRSRGLSLRTQLAAVAALLVIGAVILLISRGRVVAPNNGSNVAFAEKHAPPEPLTMRTANAWLATAPSLKTAIDDLAFRSRPGPLPQGQNSAVTVLGKEKIKL